METRVEELGLIADQASVRELTDRVHRASTVALDTEFVRETTYYPKLCLLQAATSGTVAGVDCLAQVDLAEFYDALHAPSRRWVLHSARQDLEVIWNATGRLPQRLVDTQLAAALVGFAPQISLRALLAETLGIELDKTHTRTDWAKRPIAGPALEYALDDVRHLRDLWAHLEARLVELDRLMWLEEDAARRAATPPLTDTTTLWTRLRGVSRLPDDAQRAALALVEWREREAQRLDRPRRWILSDELVVEIARARPASRAELAAVREMPKRLAARAGAEILDALHGTSSRERPEPPPRRDERVDKALVKTLQGEVAVRARALGLHAEVLATRRDLTAAALGEPPDWLATGWRSAVLADALDGLPGSG